ncbi:MAG: hypothetical protein SYC29_00360 [Planctomycetota bacterium]|nr:hypothetical protein [Planctomycetota bacterium]
MNDRRLSPDRWKGTAGKRSKTERLTHIKDARGRRVTQLDPVELRLLRRHDVIDAESLRAMAGEIGSGLTDQQKKLFRIFGVAWAVIFLVFIIHTVDVCIHGRWLEIFDLSRVALLNMVVWPILVWVRARQVRFRRIRKVMLAHRHCPHCGYDLRGLPPDEQDGATVCPECGCGWKVKEEGPRD